MCQQRIQEKSGKLSIILWVVHAEAVLGTSPDDQFIDQRIALALDLTPLASRSQCLAHAVHQVGLAAKRDPLASSLTCGAYDLVFVAVRIYFTVDIQHVDWDFLDR